MSEIASISGRIAERYATAIFGIAQEKNNLEKLETGVDDLSITLSESTELMALTQSPIVPRAEQGAAITELATRMALPQVLIRGLGLMAAKRRLFVLPQLLQALKKMLAETRDEITAEVTSATPLNEEQSAKLAETLKARMGKDVIVKATVDKDLIGGLIVKVGPKMINTSIHSRLSSLQNAMKEVG
ncbi:MAG: F0F1 ATP synthase subunit delta [Rhodobacteraceae bacterium]|nr:F0F1 ATP synthase subunit delta [Paracoccaceae bacterium]